MEAAQRTITISDRVREALTKSRMRDWGDLGLAPERGAGAPLGMRPCRRKLARVGPALHPAPGSHPSGKPDGTCSALHGRASGRGRRVAGLHKEEPAQASAQIAPVPRRR